MPFIYHDNQSVIDNILYDKMSLENVFMTTVLAMEIIITKACVFVYKYQINQ